MLFLFILSHCVGLAVVSRFTLLIISERGYVTGKGCNSPILSLTCCLLHVTSNTAQQALQIKSRNQVHKEKGDKKKKLNSYSPILLICRKSLEPASYFTVIYDRVENVFWNPSKYSVMSITWDNSHSALSRGRYFGFVTLAVQCN